MDQVTISVFDKETGDEIYGNIEAWIKISRDSWCGFIDSSAEVKLGTFYIIETENGLSGTVCIGKTIYDPSFGKVFEFRGHGAPIQNNEPQ